jgi:large subunit ribosomal protein L35
MKLKTNKSAIKRFKIKKSLLYRKKANKGHLLRKKNSNRLRRLSITLLVNNSDKKRFTNLIPYKY